MAAGTEGNSDGRVLHALETLVTTFRIQALGLMTGVLVARALGVEGRSEFAAIILWPLAIAYLGDLGLPLAYLYESARGRHHGTLYVEAIK